MGDLTGAAAAYDEASRVASSIGDVIGVLRAQVGRAKVCIALGNIPQAEFELDDAILRAGEPGLEDVRSRALHDRAHVAALRGQYERTVQFAYEALEIATSQRERDRILGDIAAGFTDLGLLHVARDAYLVLVATAQEQYVRWMAELNLLEIAARDGAEGLFDRYRRNLDRAELPPQLSVIYFLHVGRGFDLLGHPETGIEYLERAVRLASQYRFNQLAFELEGALVNARRRAGVRNISSGAQVPESVRRVAQVIEHLKLSTGTA